MQSSQRMQDKQGTHVAVIMDGNRRWARVRGLPDAAGHQAGVQALRRIVEAAPGEGIATLSVYAFSSDNWRRPESEVHALMALMLAYLDSETEEMVRNGVRFSAIGRRDRLVPDLAAEIERSETLTQWGDSLDLRVAVDYSARAAILDAARKLPPDGSDADLAALIGGESGDVDLLIRTGNEQRLSDFLLWECSYAELYFAPSLWPDFDEKELAAAMAEFRRRDRRFGGASSRAA
jgi:undecaprenyl diphosphate synthase